VEPDIPKLRKSEVIAMYAGNETWWKTFGVNRIAWGGSPVDEADADEFRNKIRLAQNAGIKYSGSLDFVTRYKLFMENEPDYMSARCVDIELKPILVPWLAAGEPDPDYPPFWFCTNNPLFKNWLGKRAAIVATLGCDGLHIDDFLGTASCNRFGGCFCDYCMEGFREFLLQHTTNEITDDFHYGRFLLERGVEGQNLIGEDRFEAPLAVEFLKFQIRSVRELVEQLQDAVKSDDDFILTVNGWLPNAENFYFANCLDAYVCEMEWNAEGGAMTGRPILGFKCAEWLGREAIVTGAGYDWAYIKANDKGGMARLWIALSYAMGGFFMVPGPRQWAWTEELGSHWYNPEAEKYSDLYHFVSENSDFFDGFRELAPITLVYDVNANNSPMLETTEKICLELTRRSVAFGVEVAGDGFFAPPLCAERLVNYAMVMYPDILDQARNDSWLNDPVLIPRCMEFSVEAMGLLSPWTIKVMPTEALMAFPRRRGMDLVIHLVNPNYDFDTDRTLPVDNVQVFMPRYLVGFRKACQIYAPGKAPMKIKVTQSRDGLWITLPRVEDWAILIMT